MNKYTRLIKTCIAIAVLPTLIACGDLPLTRQQLSDFNGQAAQLETQMKGQVSQFPLDTELQSIQGQFNKHLQTYHTDKKLLFPFESTRSVCQGHIYDMQSDVERAAVRVAECQEALKQTQKPQIPPPTSTQLSPPVNQQQPFTPETTQSIQMMNEGQFGVTNITPPPPIF